MLNAKLSGSIKGYRSYGFRKIKIFVVLPTIIVFLMGVMALAY